MKRVLRLPVRKPPGCGVGLKMPVAAVAGVAVWALVSCHAGQTTMAHAAGPLSCAAEIEHSPSVLIVMYDPEIGKEALLNAVSGYNAEIVYDYSIIPGMAIKKPDDKTLDETMRHFRQVKGVCSVLYDRVYHLDGF